MFLYNSLTQKKEIFRPLSNKSVFMYVCGITPYDATHLGHAFTYVFFDVLNRYLKFKGYSVIYTQNVTDIDDDILKRAKKEGRNWKELGDYWTRRFNSDLKSLNVKKPTHYVKATESISMMIKIIGNLIKKGFAYQKDGNVYFDIKKFKDYGKLSHFNKNQMILISKERGGNPNDPLRKSPLDFLLWQKSRPKDDEPFWESPWSLGRPGWHIECSAMVKKYLGDQIDIHGGGKDLIFPHHESEIAQSESFTNKKTFAKYWVHTSMLIYQGEKMSKSLGNLVMVSDLLKKHSPNAIRWILLSRHYRTPWEFNENELKEAQKTTDLIEKLLRRHSERSEGSFTSNTNIFEKFLDDDMNTHLVLAVLKQSAQNNNFLSSHKKFLEILGFSF